VVWQERTRNNLAFRERQEAGIIRAHRSMPTVGSRATSPSDAALSQGAPSRSPERGDQELIGGGHIVSPGSRPLRPSGARHAPEGQRGTAAVSKEAD
jgi:hypothetical protein